MFQHILVPTDGSPLSEAAAAKAMAFAREIGARVTGLSVKPQFHPFTLRPEQVEDTRGDRWDVDLHARDHLAALERAARGHVDVGLLNVKALEGRMSCGATTPIPAPQPVPTR